MGNARQVNVSPETHAILRIVAAREDRTMKELVDEAVTGKYADTVSDDAIERSLSND